MRWGSTESHDGPLKDIHVICLSNFEHIYSFSKYLTCLCFLSFPHLGLLTNFQPRHCSPLPLAGFLGSWRGMVGEGVLLQQNYADFHEFECSNPQMHRVETSYRLEWTEWYVWLVMQVYCRKIPKSRGNWVPLPHLCYTSVACM